MARIELPPGDELEQLRVLMLAPAFGKALGSMAHAVYEKSTLEVRLREAIRMKVAVLNQCQICLNHRFEELKSANVDESFYREITDPGDSDLLTEKELLVLEFTERFMTDHLSIDDSFFDKLKSYFSADELFQITSTIALLMANGRILRVLDIDAAACEL